MAGTQYRCECHASRLVGYPGGTKVATPISSPDKTRTSFACRRRGHRRLDGSVQSGGLVYRQAILGSGATIDLPIRQQCRVQGGPESIGAALTTRFRFCFRGRISIGQTSSTPNALSHVPCRRMLRQSAAVYNYAHGLNYDSAFHPIDLN